MNKVQRYRLLYLLYFIGMFYSVATNAADTDPDTIWPLCGRISANPPSDWVASAGCPAVRFGDATYSDEPLSATFGPRPLATEDNRYDFHRGVDIATPIGTPFFAIADGTVMIAGNHPSYSDPVLSVRHFRPSATSCDPTGCYRSQYLHISDWVVNESDQVVKGQLLGYTGASASGFEHLHFEVRNAPAFDRLSAWSRDAIHPLSVLPYEVANATTVVFNEVDITDPDKVRVDLSLTSNRYDLVSLDLNLFDETGKLLTQAGDTPDARGYFIEPSFFHMEKWNFMYSHKNSTAFAWESFGSGGENQCPYHADHGVSYDANVHLDQADPDNPRDGLFNGVRVSTQRYWPSDESDYQVHLEFLALQGAATCIEATATFASGDTAHASWGNCVSDFTINPGLNDAWFYPETNGQGFIITVYPELGFVSMAWFTYDTELPPVDAAANLGDAGHRWLSAIGQISWNQVVMNIEMTSGGIFDTATNITRTDPPGSDGTIILTFDSCNSGTVEYNIPSIQRQGTVPIQRVAFDNIALCEAFQMHYAVNAGFTSQG